MDDKIMVGRRKECNSLQMVMESSEAEFVVVYGRRRVGKNFLINTYYNDNYAANANFHRFIKKRIQSFGELKIML